MGMKRKYGSLTNNQQFINIRCSVEEKKKNESLLYFPPQYFTFISNIYSRFNYKSVFRD